MGTYVNIGSNILRYFFPIIFLLVQIAHSQSEIPYSEPWRWTRFTTEAGLPSNHVLAIAETPEGTVWAATSAGLAWFEGYQWVTIDSSNGLPQKPIGSIIPGLEDNVIVELGNAYYIGTKHGFTHLPFDGYSDVLQCGKDSFVVVAKNILFVYKNGKLSNFSPALKIGGIMRHRIWRTPHSDIVLQTSLGFFRFANGKWTQLTRYESNGLYADYVCENERGEGIGIFYATGGVWEWDETHSPAENKRESGVRARGVSISPCGDAIVAYTSGEVKVRKNNVWITVPEYGIFPREITTARFRDNEDLWVGTENGLYLYRNSSARWKYRMHPGHDYRNLINEILIARNGDLWIGTDGGVEILSPDGKERTIDYVGSNELKGVTGVAEDNSGNIWVSSGSRFPGCCRWDGKQWTHFSVGNATEHIYIHRILKDREQRLWLLGISPDYIDDKLPGAFLWDGTRFVNWGMKEGLLSGRVYAFSEGPDSSYWFGTLKGICKWKNGTWKYWTDKNGLRINRIFDLHVDQSNNVWFSDESYGAGCIDTNGNISYYLKKDEIAGQGVTTIREDEQGRLWFATTSGLSCFYKNVWSTLGYAEGLPSLFLWPILPDNGKLYIGTIGKGLAILNIQPDTIHLPQTFIEPPHIEERKALLRWHTLAYWGEQLPQNIEIRYRVDKQPWSAWSPVREVTISDLPSASYTFEVQSKDIFGTFSPAGASMTFTIPLPFYKHPRFVIPIASLVLIIMVLGINQITRKRKHDLALRKSEAKFRRLTEATFEGIIIHDGETIIDANKSLTMLLGFKPPELAGKPLFDLVESESHHVIKSCVLKEPEEPVEAFFLKKNGSPIIVEIISKTIPSDGSTVKVLAVRDITERKSAEQKLLAYQEQLRSLARELATTEERDRRHMSAYLHDTIGHSLAMLKITIGGIKDSTMPRRQIDQILLEVRTMVERIISDTRSLTFELSPPIIRDLSFADAVEWLTDQFQEKYNLLIYFEDDNLEKALTDDARDFLFRTIRELLVNIVKHARATSAEVLLTRVGNDLHVKVTDDGKGFDPSQLTNQTREFGNLGLFNIRERITYYGGSFSIHSGNGKGTSILLTFPL
jgi:PAS domain S-box-containing protein